MNYLEVSNLFIMNKFIKFIRIVDFKLYNNNKNLTNCMKIIKLDEKRFTI